MKELEDSSKQASALFNNNDDELVWEVQEITDHLQIRYKD
jgi:hypothetical protein